jgi:type II secretory pathway pseudopilin PulG
MNCNYNNSKKVSGITIIEIVASLALLAIISTTVLVIINRVVESATDLRLKMKAFEVARDNMEELLTQTEVEEQADYGTSEKYPDIEWETTVETFDAEGSSKMWVRAVSTAFYTNADGETDKIEFVNWLTSLSAEQQQIMGKVKEQRELLPKDEKEKTEEDLESLKEPEESDGKIDRELPPPPPQ